MTSAIHTPTRDLTGQQAPVSTGSDWRMNWLCGHKERREPGAIVKRGVLIKCAKCANPNNAGAV